MTNLYASWYSICVHACFFIQNLIKNNHAKLKLPSSNVLVHETNVNLSTKEVIFFPENLMATGAKILGSSKEIEQTFLAISPGEIDI